MPWPWDRRSDDEVLAEQEEAARIADRNSRKWNPDEHALDESGEWSADAWQANAQLMRENDEDRIDGYVAAGFDRDKIAAGFKSKWWWDEKYD